MATIIKNHFLDKVILTPWCHTTTNPKVPGVYMVNFSNNAEFNVENYAYFNGKRWGRWCHSVEEASKALPLICSVEVDVAYWRGLRFNPSTITRQKKVNLMLWKAYYMGTSGNLADMEALSWDSWWNIERGNWL